MVIGLDTIKCTGTTRKRYRHQEEEEISSYDVECRQVPAGRAGTGTKSKFYGKMNEVEVTAELLLALSRRRWSTSGQAVAGVRSQNRATKKIGSHLVTTNFKNHPPSPNPITLGSL